MCDVQLEWFDGRHKSDIEVKEVPQDLIELILRAGDIARLSDPTYPKNVFCDNVAAHEQRLVNRAGLLPLSESELKKLIRMIWLHDLPEVYVETTRDFTSVEKETDPYLAQTVASREMDVARDIFTYDDFELFIEFEHSADSIKTGILAEGATGIGVIAKVLDTIDGNMSFHYFLSLWAVSESFDPSLLPSESALTYTFRYTEKVRTNLQKLALGDNELNIAMDLLQEQIYYVVGIWDKVPRDRIPEAIQVLLEQWKNNIENLTTRR